MNENVSLEEFWMSFPLQTKTICDIAFQLVGITMISTCYIITNQCIMLSYPLYIYTVLV